MQRLSQPTTGFDSDLPSTGDDDDENAILDDAFFFESLGSDGDDTGNVEIDEPQSLVLELDEVGEELPDDEDSLRSLLHGRNRHTSSKGQTHKHGQHARRFNHLSEQPPVRSPDQDGRVPTPISPAEVQPSRSGSLSSRRRLVEPQSNETAEKSHFIVDRFGKQIETMTAINMRLSMLQASYDQTSLSYQENEARATESHHRHRRHHHQHHHQHHHHHQQHQQHQQQQQQRESPDNADAPASVEKGSALSTGFTRRLPTPPASSPPSSAGPPQPAITISVSVPSAVSEPVQPLLSRFFPRDAGDISFLPPEPAASSTRFSPTDAAPPSALRRPRSASDRSLLPTAARGRPPQQPPPPLRDPVDLASSPTADLHPLPTNSHTDACPPPSYGSPAAASVASRNEKNDIDDIDDNEDGGGGGGDDDDDGLVSTCSPARFPEWSHTAEKVTYEALSRICATLCHHTHNINDVPDPPKTGTGFPMTLPPPRHSYEPLPCPEPLCHPRPGLIAELQAHDLRRLTHPDDLINRVVFDSHEESPFLAALPRLPLPAGQLPPYFVPLSTADTTLVFDSRFESGNLRRAIQVYEHEYDLILRPDINTTGHTQWYYFSVANTRPNLRYKFNIINLTKPDSVYNAGMQPLICSTIDSRKGKGWVRAGESIAYYANTIKRRAGNFYTLSFALTLPHAHDVVYLAHCYPYTYTDLQLYLQSLSDDAEKRSRFRRRALCNTLAGNTCDLLTVTSFPCDPDDLKQRKGIVVSSRVHPGETNASWMMQGFIDYLTGASLEAKILRDNFVFKIVPMLNPDGVINGNYRCSLAGHDLNRQWIDPSNKLHPTIYYTKQMMKRFCEDREVLLFCDMHGHSRKKNIFMYGCDPRFDSFWRSQSVRLHERVLPRLLWKNADHFSFVDCNFKVQKSKEATGRVVVWREFGILRSYTLESSFCGADFGLLSNTHFTTAHLQQIGHSLCDTILDQWDPDQGKVATALRELQMMRAKPESDSDSSDSAGDSSSDDAAVSKKKRKKGGRGKTKEGRQSQTRSKPASEKNKIKTRISASSAYAAPVAGTGTDRVQRSSRQPVRGGRPPASASSAAPSAPRRTKRDAASTSAAALNVGGSGTSQTGPTEASPAVVGDRLLAPDLDDGGEEGQAGSGAGTVPRFHGSDSHAIFSRISERVSKMAGINTNTALLMLTQKYQLAKSDLNPPAGFFSSSPPDSSKAALSSSSSVAAALMGASPPMTVPSLGTGAKSIERGGDLDAFPRLQSSVQSVHPAENALPRLSAAERVGPATTARAHTPSQQRPCTSARTLRPASSGRLRPKKPT